MARSHGCIKVEIWDDPEFTKLSKQAQWTYFMLISQPEINNLGMLAYIPSRWKGFADGCSIRELDSDVAELEAKGYVLMDREKCEICVRSFIKHDKVWAQPYLVKNARAIFKYVKSERIRMSLRSRYPWLDDETEPFEIREYETSFSSQNKTPFELRPEPLSSSDVVGEGEGVGSSNVLSVLPLPLPMSDVEDPVQVIYDHWRKSFNKTHGSYGKITPLRKKRISDRLKDFSKDDLLRVLDSAASDDWGERAKFTDLELLFRNTEKVQYWLDRTPVASGGVRYWKPGDPPIGQEA